jgi:chemotaxis protein CheY-P-specific phosphatase CheC
MIVSGIKPKDEQQKEFKLNPDEVAKASIEEVKSDMIVEEAEIKVSPDEEWAEKMKKQIEGIKKEDLITDIKQPEMPKFKTNDEIKKELDTPFLISSSNTKAYIDNLKEQRKLIDKKISVMYKLDALKEITDKLFSGTMTNMANINDSKDIDSLSSKISDAIRIIADVKI